MLRLLRIDAFKAYDSQSIPLEPFNVFVGRNGSGKTSVLQAIEFLHGLVADDLATQLTRHLWAYRDLPRLASANAEFAFGALLDLDGHDLWWSVRLGKRRYENIAAETVARLDEDNVDRVLAGDMPHIGEAELLLSRTGRKMRRRDALTRDWESVTQTLTSSWLATVDPKEDQTRFPDLVRVAEWARAIVPYVVLDPNRLREPSPLTRDGIGDAGGNLAGFLRYLRSQRPDAFAAVLERAKRAYPQLEELVIQQEGSAYRLAVRESWSASQNPLLNARQASDGLLRIFALSALPESEPRPSLVMIDELENGVHPELLGALVEMLESLTENDDIQVVSTSHSPLVVTYATNPESILLTTRAEAGEAETVRLSDTPGYAALSSVFSPGEMWLARGERRLINPRGA